MSTTPPKKTSETDDTPEPNENVNPNHPDVQLLRDLIKHKNGGEARIQQEMGVETIAYALKEEKNLLIQLPTGSGKTLTYLTVLVNTGKKAVISTATKQLSEQIMNVDIPFVQKAMKEIDPNRKFTAALLKGRDNYYCVAKAERQAREEQEASAMLNISGDDSTTNEALGKEVTSLIKWAKTTRTGDRSEAPPVSDKIWKQFSSNSQECPGRKTCPFSDICFAEKAKFKASNSDLIITNHAVVATDMQLPKSSLGDREVFVFDELHELNSYLTNMWGTRLTANSIKLAAESFKKVSALPKDEVEKVEVLSKKTNPVFSKLEVGRLTPQNTPDVFNQLLDSLKISLLKIAIAATAAANDEDDNEKNRTAASLSEKRATNLVKSIDLLSDTTRDTVRWLAEEDGTPVLYAAPLKIGTELQEKLTERGATMIGTSATITVGGSFGIPLRDLGLTSSTTGYATRSLDSPFNYRKQAMIYVPDKGTFPEPVGSAENRELHAKAVRETSLEMIKAMNGKTLMLHTSKKDRDAMVDYLRKNLKKTGIEVLSQEDAPPAQIIEKFKNNQNSVLVATTGMWHGLDVQGTACSLVIMDKLPFKPGNDPLSTARKEAVEEEGGNGFMDVYVAEASVTLAQGAGRLVRSQQDKGLIAVLDPRLRTKRYGTVMLRSLPNALILGDKAQAVEALKRLRKIIENPS